MHIILDGPNKKMKLYAPSGNLKFVCEARNDTEADGYGHHGHCPPGEYGIGEPQAVGPNDSEGHAYGFFFTPLLDINNLWVPYGRDGIGIHGGGSNKAICPDPFAPHQGWVITEGCWRLQNSHNEIFVTMLKQAKFEKEEIKVTVVQP